MNPGIHIGLHWWRGFGESDEPTLFWFEYRMGFATLSIEKAWPLFHYRKLRETMVEAVAETERLKNERGYGWRSDTSSDGH